MWAMTLYICPFNGTVTSVSSIKSIYIPFAIYRNFSSKYNLLLNLENVDNKNKIYVRNVTAHNNSSNSGSVGYLIY